MRKPEELVARIDRSIFAKALVISIVAHAALMGATSVSLGRRILRTESAAPFALACIAFALDK